MNATAKPTVTTPAKIEFSAVAGDRYEKTVDVTADGHYVGELYRAAGDDWMPGQLLAYEMESLNRDTWATLAAAKRACRAAAAVARNRVARLRHQRRALAEAERAAIADRLPATTGGAACGH